MVRNLLQLGHRRQLAAERALVALHERGVQPAEQHRTGVHPVADAAAAIRRLVAAPSARRAPASTTVARLLRPVTAQHRPPGKHVKGKVW